jgi:beta-N-acetylhexosaminidase
MKLVKYLLQSLIVSLSFVNTCSYSMDISKQNCDDLEKLMQELTCEEKIGQLFMIATVVDPTDPRNARALGITPNPTKSSPEFVQELIKDYHVGGLIIQGRSDIKPVANLIREYQKFNIEHNKIPLWFGQDLEWGLTMRIDDAVRFPKNMTLGAISDNDLLYAMGREIGRQCEKLGVHINFAPVSDINSNPANPIIGDRSFGENKELVAQRAIAIMKGLQDTGIIACAKHFPGHGDTGTDSHLTLPVILHDKKRITDVELFPFRELIKAGVKSIMTAHLAVPVLEPKENLPASLSRAIVTKLLKEECGFNKLIITDGLDMQGVCEGREDGYPELGALLAGNDLLLCPRHVPETIKLIKGAVKEGIILKTELDGHVTKILATKAKIFVRQQELANLEDLQNQLHTQEAYDLKRILYREAITLICNDNNILPLTRNKSICYVQIGSTEASPFGKTLAQQFSLSLNILLPSEISEFDKNNLFSQIKVDDTVVIGMVGMTRAAAQQYGITESIKKVINELKDYCTNVILVIFGSPYSLKWFEDIPAIIVAYEDDPDAQVGAAEVISGALSPKGKLPVTASDKFPFGLGLSYKAIIS